MNDRFISTDYRTDCYHCRQVADQHIVVTPNRADVTCTSCGATRVFVPRMEEVDETGTMKKPDRWPVWALAVDAACRHCGVSGAHDLVVSCRTITVQCRHCRFTHLFRFDLEYLAADPSGKKPARTVDRHSGTCP